MQTIRVVTISRQIGSMGLATGKLVAELQGWSFTCRDAINQAAMRAGAPQAALAMIDEFRLLGFNLNDEENQAYIKAISHVMHELAEKGKIVIVGRAGQVILASRPDALHIRMIAPAEIRATRLAERHKIPLPAAMAQVIASDRHRNQYLKKFYNTNWNDPSLYDIILNTTKMTLEDAAFLINNQISRNK